MKGPIPYRRPTRFHYEGVLCLRPGSQYSRNLSRNPLQIYKHWWDDVLGLWFAVCDRPHDLCIPHRYAWMPNAWGNWRWIMVDQSQDMTMAIAVASLVVYDEKGPRW